jgi:DNA-binding XRE family transcriptional regulator
MATVPNHPPYFVDRIPKNRYTPVMTTKTKRGRGRPVDGPDHPLAHLRKKSGYSREKLAELLGDVTAETIAMVERRRSQFPVSSLVKLAEVFGLRINDKLIAELYPKKKRKRIS